MSSSVVAESPDSHKSENTVIIIVNNDGSISVDEQTLQNLLAANQQNATVSVVRVGSQSDDASQDSAGSSESIGEGSKNAGQPQVNLTVEGYYPPVVAPTSTAPSGSGDTCTSVTESGTGGVVVGGDSLVDPFLEMDPEQLERLETALQSEQAKQILGEGVTAMLDMLTSEDDQTTLKDSIRMDHCYTNLEGSRGAAGSSGTASKDRSVSEDDDSDEDDEDEDESEEQDSEEEARTRRGSRGRGRGRGVSRGGRGATASGGRGKGRGRGKKVASPLTPGLATTSRNISIQYSNSKMAQTSAGRVTQTAKLTPAQMAKLTSGGTVQIISASGVKTNMTLPAQSVVRSAVGNLQPKVQLAQAEILSTGDDAAEEGSLVINEKGGVRRGGFLGRGRARLLLASQAMTPQPLGKGRRKSVTTVSPPPVAVPLKTILRRSTVETPDTKKEVKSPPARRASIVTEDAPAVKSPPTVAAIPVSTSPTIVSDAPPDLSTTRKFYPKRENRKPPAHLAEAFGPALFSTPDVPRRISDSKPELSIDLPIDLPDTTEKVEPNVLQPLTKEENLQIESSECKDEDQVENKPISQLEQRLREKVEEPKSESTGTASFSSIISPAAEQTSDILPDSISPEPELDSKEMLVAELQAVLGELGEDFQNAVKEEEKITVDAEPTEPSQDLLAQQPLEEQMEEKVEDILVNPTLEAADDDSMEDIEPLVIEEKIQLVKAPPAKSFPTKSTVSKIGQVKSSVKPKAKTAQIKAEGAKGSKVEPEPIAGPSTASGSKRRGGGGLSKLTVEAIKHLQEPSDEEVEADDDEESWNSEDDPDRLWCICKKPHNNRFMICCDKCEDWFHGKCVGVTKAMGQQMEERGQEWTCPNCKKLLAQKQVQERTKGPDPKKQQPQQQSNKATSAEKKRRDSTVGPDTSTPQKRKPVGEDKIKPATPAVANTILPTLASPSAKNVTCIVCKKAARAASIYCGDACILKHAQESLSLLNKEKTPKVGSGECKIIPESNMFAAALAGDSKMGSNQDSKVIVYERKTGKLIAGNNAPTISNLKNWLKEHPTFEVVRPGLLSSLNLKAGQKVSVQGQKQGTIIITKPAGSPTKLSTAGVAKVPGSPNKAGPSATVKVATSSGSQQKTAMLVPAQRMPAATKPLIAGKGSTTAAAGKAGPGTPIKGGKVADKQQLSSKTPPSQPSKAVSNSKTPPASSPTTTTPTLQSSNERVRKQSLPGPEPIRINVRKTLQQLLQSRIQECDDLKVSDSEVKKMATSIEEELFANFKDTGAKYKSKYRSLVFNIKDPKNLALFRKIVEGEVSPHRLVRLSAEELATKELAQWREREAQHTLEMIKKNELDLMNQAITYVMKTHKGEQVIEKDDMIKLQASAVAAEPVLGGGSVSSTVEDLMLETPLPVSAPAAPEPELKKLSSSKEREYSRRDKESRSRRHDKGKHSRKDKDGKSSSSSALSSRNKISKDSKAKDSKDSRDKESKEKESRDKDSRHRDSRDSRHSSESRSSKRRHHSSESGDHEKTSRSNSSLDKHSENIKSKDTKESKNSTSFQKSLKAPTSTSETPPLPVQEIVQEQILKPSEPEEPSDTNTNISNLEEIHSMPAPSTEDGDLSDREPSSTVTIKTPDSNVEEPDKTSPPSVWRGFINMLDVAKFFISAHEVSGSAAGLNLDLPDTLDVVGRISPDTVWEYISKMKKSGTKDIVVIRLDPANPEEKLAYISFYSYLSTRNRFGVVGNKCSAVKDFYIMPLSSHSPVPQVLLPLDGPGFEESRPHLLLGILVHMRRKRPADSAGLSTSSSSKISKEPKNSERSYTPPLPTMDRESGSYTPPLPATPPPRKVGLSKRPPAPPLSDKDDQPYSPGGSTDSPSLSPPPSHTPPLPQAPAELSSKLEELNRKIEEQKQQIENISSELVTGNSPTDSLQVTTLLRQISSQVLTASGSGLSQTLVQASSVMEVTQQGFSSSSATEKDDENEAYSPSRSFTPPPQSTDSNPSFSIPDTSSISLPSNLQEILASIQRKAPAESATGKGLSLQSDPIVREYASVEEPTESTPPPLNTSTVVLESSVSMDVDMRQLVFPAGAVIPPASLPPDRLRDPRRAASEPSQKPLSRLTDAELIAKANEMLESSAPPSVQAGVSQIPLQPSLVSTVSNFPFPNTNIPPPTSSLIPPILPGASSISLSGIGDDARSKRTFTDSPPPSSSRGEWHAASSDESPRKGISFRVGKRPTSSRWSRGSVPPDKRHRSGPREDWDCPSDKKRSPKRSPSPLSRSRRSRRSSKD